jgi:hypothetical protein
MSASSTGVIVFQPGAEGILFLVYDVIVFLLDRHVVGLKGAGMIR